MTHNTTLAVTNHFYYGKERYPYIRRGFLKQILELSNHEFSHFYHTFVMPVKIYALC